MDSNDNVLQELSEFVKEIDMEEDLNKRASKAFFHNDKKHLKNKQVKER